MSTPNHSNALNARAVNLTHRAHSCSLVGLVAADARVARVWVHSTTIVGWTTPPASRALVALSTQGLGERNGQSKERGAQAAGS